MKFLFTIGCLLCTVFCLANMASPVRKGTVNGNALTSRNIQILSERIDITLSKNSAIASFDVVYNVRTTVAGRQVPLLFVADDYERDFEVWTDDKPVTVQQVTDSFRTTLSAFDDFIAGHPAAELQYFETGLDTGIHTIRVRYAARPATDHPTWINTCTLEYLLEPAKRWKSFGQLDIVLHIAGFPYAITTDLPPPVRTDSTMTWHFNGIPQNSFSITYKATPRDVVAKLINIGPFPFAVVLSVLLLLLNLWLMARYRRRSKKRFNPFVIAGSLLVPFLFCFSFVLFDGLINALLPPLLRSPDGYVFLVFIIFYPFVTPVYWCAMWLADRYFKKRTMRRDRAVFS